MENTMFKFIGKHIRMFVESFKDGWYEGKLAHDSKDCPFEEPLHNHHDGCPSCETA
jgi:hypothetical protein